MSDTIPKVEVARVLANAWQVADCAADANLIRAVAARLGLRPEFESALAALEQKEDGNDG